ncbi:hypothetical protein [Rhizobium leguminosarum]|uniref:hypothetical protein n=1 Tax=Rhizobium leguminosarum TaxID=384 RepID=UPI0013D9C08C|nr:hypothetical protein [Rhizobium leguminosarum]NEI02411.1 hypothetical protein [Rhizobium leguminosarum]
MKKAPKKEKCPASPERQIFAFWTGDNQMSANRLSALASMHASCECPVIFLSSRNIRSRELPEAPFHAAYDFLSDTHKADYLRCYFMHHYGGGYSDIKRTTKSWASAFDSFNDPLINAAGYREIDADSVAPVGGELETRLRRHYRNLMGNGAYVFRPRTIFTQKWYDATHLLLDTKLAELAIHTARHPRDFQGAELSPGCFSQYPLKWTEMLGNIFHPIAYEFRRHVAFCDIEPSFRDYY